MTRPLSLAKEINATSWKVKNPISQFLAQKAMVRSN